MRSELTGQSPIVWSMIALLLIGCAKETVRDKVFGLEQDPSGTGGYYRVLLMIVDGNGVPLDIPTPKMYPVARVDKINEFFNFPVDGSFSVMIFYYSGQIDSEEILVLDNPNGLERLPDFYYYIPLSRADNDNVQVIGFEETMVDIPLAVRGYLGRVRFLRTDTTGENDNSANQVDPPNNDGTLIPIDVNIPPLDADNSAGQTDTLNTASDISTDDSVPIKTSKISLRDDLIPFFNGELSGPGCIDCHNDQKDDGGLKLKIGTETTADDIYRELTEENSTEMPSWKRINKGTPLISMILTKPLFEEADPQDHEGGYQFGVGEPGYQLILTWIIEGAQNN